MLYPRRAFGQNPVEPGHEHRHRHGCGQNVTDRLGEKYRENLVREKEGQQENQRDQQNQLAQTGQQQTHLGLTQRHKGLLTAGLESRRENPRHVDPHGPDRIVDQFLVGAENRRKQMGHQHHRHPEQPRVPHADGELAPERLAYPVRLAGAEVVADQRLAALADALQRHGNQLAHAGDDGHGPHRQVSAVAGQAGVEADAQNALCGQHHKGGNPQRKAGGDHRGRQLQVFPAQLQLGLGSGQKPQHPHRADPLAEHRGDGRAPYPHAETEDQDGVQHNVAQRPDHGGHHAQPGKALGGDEGIDAHDNQDEDAAQHIDPGVTHPIGQGGVAGPEQPQQLGRKGEEEGGQHHRQPDEHRQTVAHDPLGAVLVVLAQGDGRPGRAACPAEHGESVDQHQNRHAEPHAGQRRGADALDVPDVDSVHNVIQQIDDLGDHRRHGQRKHPAADAPRTHVGHWGGLCHCSGPSLSYTVPL